MEVKIKRYKSGKDKGSVKTNNVVIDKEDSWSCAWTIAQIAGPLLKQLKETSHGYGAIAKDDVPQELHSTYEGGKFSKEAWDWVLDEVVWAMNEIATDNANEPQPYDVVGEMEWSEPDERGCVTLLSSGLKEIPDKRALYDAYHARIQNGCRLFGVYLNTFWD